MHVIFYCCNVVYKKVILNFVFIVVCLIFTLCQVLCIDWLVVCHVTLLLLCCVPFVFAFFHQDELFFNVLFLIRSFFYITYQMLTSSCYEKEAHRQFAQIEE